MDQIVAELGSILNLPLTLPVIFAILQIVLDLVLIFIVLFLLKRISGFDPGKFETLLKALKESHELCEQLNRTVAKNERIAGKIQEIMEQSGTGGSEKESARMEPHQASGSASNEAVRKLWAQGRSIDEIADATGTPRGEVEVMVSLLGRRGL